MGVTIKVEGLGVDEEAGEAQTMTSSPRTPTNSKVSSHCGSSDFMIVLLLAC